MLTHLDDKTYSEKCPNHQCFDSIMLHAPGLLQQKPFQIRISYYIFCCGGLASNEEDFSRDWFIINLAISFLYQFCISSTNWYVGKIRLKIHMEESKDNGKNAKKVNFELHQLLTFWILSRNRAVWNVWCTVNMTPINCYSNP